MPSGPDHYLAAEAILAEIEDTERRIATDGLPLGTRGQYAADRATAIDIAKVHQGLAQAAAIALSAPVDDQPPDDARRWYEVARTMPSTPPADVVEATIYEADGSEPKAAESHNPALQDRYSARKLYAWPCINHEIGLRIDNSAAMFVDAAELQRFIEQRAAGEPDEQPF